MIIPVPWSSCTPPDDPPKSDWDAGAGPLASMETMAGEHLADHRLDVGGPVEQGRDRPRSPSPWRPCCRDWWRPRWPPPIKAPTRAAASATTDHNHPGPRCPTPSDDGGLGGGGGPMGVTTPDPTPARPRGRGTADRLEARARGRPATAGVGSCHCGGTKGAVGSVRTGSVGSTVAGPSGRHRHRRRFGDRVGQGVPGRVGLGRRRVTSSGAWPSRSD